MREDPPTHISYACDCTPAPPLPTHPAQRTPEWGTQAHDSARRANLLCMPLCAKSCPQQRAMQTPPCLMHTKPHVHAHPSSSLPEWAQLIEGTACVHVRVFPYESLPPAPSPAAPPAAAPPLATPPAAPSAVAGPPPCSAAPAAAAPAAASGASPAAGPATLSPCTAAAAAAAAAAGVAGGPACDAGIGSGAAGAAAVPPCTPTAPAGLPGRACASTWAHASSIKLQPRSAWCRGSKVCLKPFSGLCACISSRWERYAGRGRMQGKHKMSTRCAGRVRTRCTGRVCHTQCAGGFSRSQPGTSSHCEGRVCTQCGKGQATSCQCELGQGQTCGPPSDTPPPA